VSERSRVKAPRKVEEEEGRSRVKAPRLIGRRRRRKEAARRTEEDALDANPRRRMFQGR